jgi:hypothetical protein
VLGVGCMSFDPRSKLDPSQVLDLRGVNGRTVAVGGGGLGIAGLIIGLVVALSDADRFAGAYVLAPRIRPPRAGPAGNPEGAPALDTWMTKMPDI